MIWLLLACGGGGSGGAADLGVPVYTELVDTGERVASTTPTTSPDTAPVEVSTRAIVCADPTARDVQPFDLWEGGEASPLKAWFASGGLGVADFDGNGRLDLLIPGIARSFFYLGTDDGWVDASILLARLPLALGSGVSVADYDGDGDADALVTRFLAPDTLLRNDGDGFVDVSAEAGLAWVATRSIQSSWADLDRDGDLDLFIGSYGELDEGPGAHEDFLPADPSFLYLNNGDGTFTNVSERIPQSVHDGYTLGGGFHDLDRDGWPDLYVVNDFGVSTPNALLWNRGGLFEADENRSGLDVSVTGMGLAVADVNGDRQLDLFIPEWDGLHLYESGRYDTWIDWSVSRGVVNDPDRDQKIAWGGELVDLDHDGDLDIPVAYGHLDSTYPSERVQPDALFIREGDGYVDRAAEWGFDHGGISRGMVAADLNDDGWLDLVVRTLDGPARVYLSRCGSAAWLRVQLEQPGANPDAIGAQVSVRGAGRIWDADIRAGGTSFASGGPPEAHFGLAELDRVAEIEVRWPDGAISVVSDVGTRQVVHITRRDAGDTVAGERGH
ncbi:MAG: hypothetical protein ACI8PZ_000824 [Myxococcota bacterium]